MMFKRLFWYWQTDRLGPDILTTHLLLFFKKTSRWISKKKFCCFGDGSEFRPYAYAVCTSNISIGRNVVIRPGTMLFADNTTSGQICIEDDVEIGSGVHFYVNDHAFDNTDTPIKYQGYYPSEPIRVCNGAWIGANAIILKGVIVGKNSVIGAGSIVTKNVTKNTVVAGNPAKIIKNIIPSN
jgi:acetyltransferase-like isoleucine patch superfamily enzyme